MRTPNTRARAFGIERHVDAMGRVVIPKDFMHDLHWTAGYAVQVRMVEDGILITPAPHVCQMCHHDIMEDQPLVVDGRAVCRPCAKAVAETLLVSHGR